jgi:hypothetical protein
MPTAFISYSHDSPSHERRVLELAQALRDNGIDVELDQFHNEEIIDWPEWCEEQIRETDFVLCVCTEKYRNRIENNVSPERGKGAYWEGSLVRHEMYDQKGSGRFLPVLLDDEPETSIPRVLQCWTCCRVERFTLDDPGYEHVIRILTGQARVVKRPVGEIPDLGTESGTVPEASASALPHVRWTDQLRIYGEAGLFAGRGAELEMLDLALEDGAFRVVSVWAEGGAGKTRLLFQWLNRLRDDGWRVLSTVFVHSFYSQGSGEDRGASSDRFFDEALAFFGYEGQPITDPTEKGRELARRVADSGALLVLDGVEPLQYPPHNARRGELKDPALRELLLTLTNAPDGLCVLTTRQELPELASRRGAAVRQQPLDRLSPEDGVELLGALEIEGNEKELRSAVEDYHGHAYSLMLLGT